MISTLIHLATREQLDFMSLLLRDLGYAPDEPFFLAGLKKISGRTRIRTSDEAETAIDLLLKILARRERNAVAADPETGGRGHAA